MIDSADDWEAFFGPKSSSVNIPGQQTHRNQTIRLHEYIPISSNGSVLITTRDKRVGELLCDRQTATKVHLLDSLKAETMLQSRIPAEKWNIDYARNLLCELDSLPLAITQAAAFINDNHITIKEYLSLLHDGKLGATELLSANLLDSRRDLDTPSSVIQT